MNNGKLLTVIIPNYNKEKYLEQCIQSVINQTYRPIEIIIVDDCSSDSSKEIIETFEKKYPYIKSIFQKKNGGVSLARNTGALAAAGEYITFLDSDDFYCNCEKLTNEMNLLAENKEILSYSKLVYVDEAGMRLDKSGNRILEGKCVDQIIRNCPFEILPRDYCINKEIFIKCGMYDINSAFYEDLDLLIRLTSCTSVKCTKSDGTAYRQVNNGLSSKSREAQLRGRWKVSYEALKKIKACRSFSNIIYVFLWKINIEIKILAKKILFK